MRGNNSLWLAFGRGGFPREEFGLTLPDGVDRIGPKLGL